MNYIADLEIHSKFARACSPNSDLEHHAEFADIKGIDIVGTGDFTHPIWFKDMKTKFKEAGDGVYQLKNQKHKSKFLLSAEVSCIYRKNDATRRIHVLLFAPNLESAEKFNKKLKANGAKLAGDGRPILGMDIKNLLEMALEVDKNFLVIPAHVWTPWFGFYGSKSGFDSLEEAFEDLTPYVAGIETGLSSDPPMNWRLEELDNKAIVSFSDAHSPANLAREATVFELEQPDFTSIHNAIWRGFRTTPLPSHSERLQGAEESPTNVGGHTPEISRQARDDKQKNKIDYTIEFFPEEGKYHYDGHRDCKISLNPEETRKNKGICPVCKKNLTVGVLYRVQELANRPEGYTDKARPPFKSLIPLQEVIAEAYGVGKNSKRVQAEYFSLCKAGINEFNVLLNLPEDELKTLTEPLIAAAIMHMRQGEVKVTPGYDGIYGVIEIFSEKDREKSQPAKLF